MYLLGICCSCRKVFKRPANTHIDTRDTAAQYNTAADALPFATVSDVTLTCPVVTAESSPVTATWTSTMVAANCHVTAAVPSLAITRTAVTSHVAVGTAITSTVAVGTAITSAAVTSPVAVGTAITSSAVSTTVTAVTSPAAVGTVSNCPLLSLGSFRTPTKATVCTTPLNEHGSANLLGPQLQSSPVLGRRKRKSAFEAEERYNFGLSLYSIPCKLMNLG